MPFWNRKSAPADRISSQALADFGRYEFLGADQSGIDPSNAYGLISNLNELIYTSSPAGRAEAIAELHRHAEKGEWEKVGAWKYVREFLSAEPGIQDLIDGGLIAIHHMRVTNLSIHLAPIDTPRYTELAGAPPPNDGFFGPPVFDSNFGPTRQYYFDHAIATVAARNIMRLQSTPGVEPGPIGDAARAMWDFGLLVHRGPLVVNPDIAFEPHVVHPAVAAASGVDHNVFADRLADAVLDTRSPAYGVWSSIGGARFIEDYLDTSAVKTTGYSRLLDSGLTLLTNMGALGVSITPEILTPRQRNRLATLRSLGQ
jgi:hypothetical protein